MYVFNVCVVHVYNIIVNDLDPNDILHTKDAGNRSQIATTFNPTVLGPLVIPLGWYA